jgi:osmotically-inducible protein OsmY
MTEAPAPAMRSDLDIQDDIEDVILHYPPANNDRHHIDVRVEGGVATISGHAKTPITRLYLLNAISLVRGVNDLRADRFYDDETLRLELGQVIPLGIYVNVEYGTVVLSGTLSDEMTDDELVRRVASVRGVNRVVTAFRS